MRHNLIDRLKEEWAQLEPVDPLRGLIADAIDALAEQPAQQQEPVAWVKVTEHWLSAMPRLEIAKPNEEGAKPVYMQPPASKPLTDEKADEAIKAYWGEMKGGPLMVHRAYIRAIEAAHGIKG